jgi:acyl carrier protein
MVVTPTREEVERRLIDLTTEVAKIPRQRIVNGATFEDDLRMESIAFVEIHVALEDEYDVEIDPLQVIELNEFGAIVDYVHRQITETQNAKVIESLSPLVHSRRGCG